MERGDFELAQVKGKYGKDHHKASTKQPLLQHQSVDLAVGGHTQATDHDLITQIKKTNQPRIVSIMLSLKLAKVAGETLLCLCDLA